MALKNKLSASTTMEAVVSVAIISAMMVIVFPFFGQVLNSNHRMEIIKGFHLLNDVKNSEDFDLYSEQEQEFSNEGISIRFSLKQDEDVSELFHVTTEIVNDRKKVIYSFVELKYHP